MRPIKIDGLDLANALRTMTAVWLSANPRRTQALLAFLANMSEGNLSRTLRARSLRAETLMRLLDAMGYRTLVSIVPK